MSAGPDAGFAPVEAGEPVGDGAGLAELGDAGSVVTGPGVATAGGFGSTVAVAGRVLSPSPGTSASRPASPFVASIGAVPGCPGVKRCVGTFVARCSAARTASSIESPPHPAASTARPTLDPANAARARRRPTGPASRSIVEPDPTRTASTCRASTSDRAVGAGSGGARSGGAQWHDAASMSMSSSADWRTLPPTLPPLTESVHL